MSMLGVAVTVLACGREGATLPSGLPGAESPLRGSLGLAPFNDQPWNGLTGNGWRYLRRTASKDSDIVSDPTAPVSPPQALRIIFTTDMARDSEPGVHWIGLPAVEGGYSGWVDGVLNGDYGDVRFPSGGFVQFEFAPTLQNPPPAEQYMYVDHTQISIR